MHRNMFLPIELIAFVKKVRSVFLKAFALGTLDSNPISSVTDLNLPHCFS